MLDLPPIANFQLFDPQKVQSYRLRRAMILASITQPKAKKISASKGPKRTKSGPAPLSAYLTAMLAQAQAKLKESASATP